MHYARTLKLAIVSVAVGGVTAALLTFAAVPVATSTAEATPVLAKGQPCSTCHTSSKPSKADLKKKK
jgi:hypothetical protein